MKKIYKLNNLFNKTSYFVKSISLKALLVLMLLAPNSFADDSGIASVVSASSLQFALVDIAKSFEADTGKTAKVTFSSSGNAYRQILQEAPFELFLSADENFVLDLAKTGKTIDDGYLYAVGRVVLLAPENSPVKVDAALNDVKTALTDGRLSHFAIANPDHAPYGRAAREALKNQNLWNDLSEKIVLGENVSQAAQFITSGSAEAGIVPLSLVLKPNSKGLSNYVLLPESWHKPINQRMALLKNAGETAKSFYDYLKQPKAQAIFAKYGFVLPSK